MSVFLNCSSTGSNVISVGAPTEIKTTYSSKEFITLLWKKHPFPSNIIVAGDVNLSGWTGLTSLPERLTVKGNLNLSGCTRLTSLPEGLIVEGDVILSGCIGLGSLPDWITTLGSLANGNERFIYLDGITISKAYREKLYEAHKRGGIELSLTVDGIQAFHVARLIAQ